MIIAAKMKDAVDHELVHFARKGVTGVVCLPQRNVGRNHHVSKMLRWGGANEVDAADALIRLGWKRKDIRCPVVSPELLIQLSHCVIADESDGQICAVSSDCAERRIRSPRDSTSVDPSESLAIYNVSRHALL